MMWEPGEPSLMGPTCMGPSSGFPNCGGLFKQGLFGLVGAFGALPPMQPSHAFGCPCGRTVRRRNLRARFSDGRSAYFRNSNRGQQTT